MAIDDLIFQAFNRHVVALSKADGCIVWQWRAPEGSYFTAVLIEDGRAFVSSSGYTYCLDAASGMELWSNELKGMGTGIPCFATARQSTQLSSAAAAAVAAIQAASSSTTVAAVG